MSTRKTNVPAIPEITQSAESIDRTLRALKEATEVGYGRRGDKLDRFVTLRDLRDGGVAQVSGVGGGSILGLARGPGTGAPLPEFSPPDYGDTDYTTPPQPRNVKVRSIPPEIDAQGDSAGGMMVTWDPPDYSNHYYAEVYRMPWDGLPQVDGKPVFPIAPDGATANGLVMAYAYGVHLPDGEVNEINPGDTALAGVSEGTIFMDRDLPMIPEVSGSELDQALNPGTYYYWVRFVSRAMIPGPLSERAGGTLSINPALVLDAMTRNVTNTGIFRHLREWLDLGSPEARAGGGILSYIDTAIDESGIKSIWSVRMGHTAGGQVFASGFGLGMETTRNPEGDWSSLSTFLVNANQFAIMGPNSAGGGARITSWAGSGEQLTLTLATSSHGFKVEDPRQRAVLTLPEGDIRREVEGQEPTIIEIPTSLTRFAGTEVEVVSVAGNTVTVTSDVDDRHPQHNAPGMFPAYGAIPEEWGFALMPGHNIPFIVDATREVVGIRGSLIVDGLVRGTTGEFNELVANTAFIQKLQAEVVNANLVIGQRIIAGVPGSGALHSNYNEISNYIIELNNPTTSQYPLLFWKPQTQHRVFSLDNQGNMHVGGQMTVGGSAVIAGELRSQSDVIFSTGGYGADTGSYNWSPRYAMWIGTVEKYGNAGMGRTEQNALMYVRSDGRAGFNLDLFLGGDPLALPSGNGYITVKPRQNGGMARVFVSATFSIIGQADLEQCRIGASLYLVPETYVGPGYGPVRSGVGFDPDPTTVSQFAGWFGNMGDGGPSIPGGIRATGTQVDSRNKSADVKSRALQGSVVVAAGRYKVFLALWNKGGNGSGGPHGCFSVHPFAMQVSNDATASTMHSTQGDEAVATARPPAIPDARLDPDWIVASEDILHGQFVNIHEVGGFARIRRADSTIPYEADGWLMYSAREGDRVQVYRDGINPYLEGLTPGTEYALGIQGAVVPLVSAAGKIIQTLGKALTDTSMQVEIDEPVGRS